VTNSQLTLIRTVATALITALTGLLVVYPHEPWTALIAAAITAGSAVGIHAIPAVSQLTMKGNVMSESPNTPFVAPGQSGLELMGQVKPVQPPINTGTVYQQNADGSFSPVVTTATETAPEAAPALPQAVPATTALSATPPTPAPVVDPSVADLLENVIAGLQQIVGMVRG
jgi:hypothetical protein